MGRMDERGHPLGFITPRWLSHLLLPDLFDCAQLVPKGCPEAFNFDWFTKACEDVHQLRNRNTPLNFFDQELLVARYNLTLSRLGPLCTRLAKLLERHAGPVVAIFFAFRRCLER